MFTQFRERKMPECVTDAIPAASTFVALERLSRLAHFSRDGITANDADVFALLHEYNDRQPFALPASLVDELALLMTRTRVPA